MASLSPPAPIEVPYKHLEDGSPVFLDLYLDTQASGPNAHNISEDEGVRSVLIYFHGGGLTVGNC